jgi:hypothetical protein
VTRLERGGLAVLALLIVGVFLPSARRDSGVALGDRQTTTLMNAQSAAGPGLASAGSQATPTESGADRYFFQYHASASGVDVAIQQSGDGTTWATVYTFARNGPDEVWSAPTCGACLFRAFKLNTTTATATVILTMSGASVALAPSYTPTSTPTATRTPTVTPTH